MSGMIAAGKAGSSSKAAGPRAATRKQVELTRKVCAFIDAALAEDAEAAENANQNANGEEDSGGLTLAALAARAEVSPWHLQRVFKRVMGVSPRDYADARRSALFRAELRNGESVAGATYGAGYGSASRVYERAAHHLGMTPASYAKGGKGARIAYAPVDSPLGCLLVASTDKGICFVALGDDAAALEAELQAEFPQAEALVRDEAALAPTLRLVLAHIAGDTPHLDLPLDVRATAFQRRVWQELGAIPYGETRSYSEIAAALGLPKGQRAVGRACATNPVSLVIPCHRALREDGALGGYRWGLARKRALLRQEAERSEATAVE